MQEHPHTGMRQAFACIRPSPISISILCCPALPLLPQVCKHQITIAFVKVFLPMLTLRSSSYVQRITILKLLQRICADAKILIEVCVWKGCPEGDKDTGSLQGSGKGKVAVHLFSPFHQINNERETVDVDG